MAAEKQTRIKADLPKGELLVAMRVSGLGNITLSGLHGATLHDLMPPSYGSARFKSMSLDEGSLYVGFAARNLGQEGADEETVLRDSSALLWQALAKSAVPGEVNLALCDTADQISPDRPLHESFAYMTGGEVTRSVLDNFADFEIEAPPGVGHDLDLIAELEHSLS